MTITNTIQPIKVESLFGAANAISSLLLTGTPLEVQHAWMIASERAKGHDHCRKPQEALGDPAEQQLNESYGALGEVILLNALFRNGLMPEGYQMVASTAPVGPDFTLNGISYQIKSVPPNRRYLCVNEQQRLNPAHASDFYLPVVFTTPNILRVLNPIASAAVSQWALRYGHSAYRSIDIAKLPGLLSLQSLSRN